MTYPTPTPNVSRQSLDQWFSRLLGLTLMGWSGVWTYRCLTSQTLTWKTLPIITLTLLTLNMMVGVSFMIRREARSHPTKHELMMCAPSLILSWFTFHFAPPQALWPAACLGLFGVGVLGVIWSLLYLGKSFSVFPAMRQLVTRGPYRLIRHPLYISELMMAFSGGIVSGLEGEVILPACALLTTIMIGVRVSVEERHLSQDELYQLYVNRVRWRLVPWVW